MDDVLVDFDPGRARRTARILGGLSLVRYGPRQQILFFTFHPHTAALLREVQGERGGVLPAADVAEIAAAYGWKETFLAAVIKRYPGPGSYKHLTLSTNFLVYNSVVGVCCNQN